MPTQEIERAGAVLPVREVVEIVREWVDRYARRMPDFAGAYLWGGITALSADAPFPLYRDVDVVVVLTQGAQEDNLEVLHRGVMLEVILLDLAAHRDVEAVLANPSHGPNMATTQILADPTGILAPLREAVAAQYDRRRWIQARCDTEKTWAEKHLADMAAAVLPYERLDATRSLLSALSGLLAVSQLERPTTRRTLALLGELLDAQGRADLHEAALRVMGSAEMRRADVEAHLDTWTAAFDRSVEVIQTPIPYGFTICAHLRPYYVQGAQEMIAQGQHREAAYWIALLDTSYIVLQNDAPEAEKPGFAAQWQAMLAALGFDAPAEEWAARVEAAKRLTQEIARLAAALAARHPE